MEASPLHSIPREIRDQIYELAVYNPEGVLLSVSDNNETRRKPSRKRTTTPRPSYLALAQCCKQLRDKSEPIFYAQNTFSFDTCEFRGTKIRAPGRSITGVKAWIEKLDERCKLLGAVTIGLGVCDPVEDEYTASDPKKLVGEYKSLFGGRHKIKLTVEIQYYCDDIDERLPPVKLPVYDLEQAGVNVKGLACSLEKKKTCYSCRFVQNWLLRTIMFMGNSGNT